MNFLKKSLQDNPNRQILLDFLEKYWYVPSDVLQRGLEANIWTRCSINHPVLDIGIGNGSISKLLFKNWKKIDIGIDIEEKGLQEAFKTNMYKKVIRADAENMPFSSNTFESVISNSTFEHIGDDKKAVSEVSRVLKKGGCFFYTVPSSQLIPIIFLNRRKNKNKINFLNKRLSHLHYRSLPEWRKILKKNKLELVFSHFYFPENTAKMWYKLLILSTAKISKKELWSVLGFSKITRFIPKELVKYILKRFIIKTPYFNGLSSENEGGMIFMVAKKI